MGWRRSIAGCATSSLLALCSGGCSEDRVPIVQEDGPTATDEEPREEQAPAYLRVSTTAQRESEGHRRIGGLAGRRVCLRVAGSESRLEVLADAARCAGVSVRVEEDARDALQAAIDGPCHDDDVALAVAVEWCLPDDPPMEWEERPGEIVVGRMKAPAVVDVRVYDLDDVVPLPVAARVRSRGAPRAGEPASDGRGWPPEAAQALARLVRDGVGRKGTWDLPGVALEPVGSSCLLVKHGRVVLAQVDDFLARFRRYVEGRSGIRPSPAGASLGR